MSAVPGEPLKRQPFDVKLKDGRKVKLKLPGMTPGVEAAATQERGAAQAPGEDPAARRQPRDGTS